MVHMIFSLLASPKGSPNHPKSVGATGGVYKGQGLNQRKLMTYAYQEFLVKDPQLQRSIPSTMHTGDYPMPFSLGTYCMHQCSTRAAQDIQGHHRPVIALNFLEVLPHSPSKKQPIAIAKRSSQQVKVSFVIGINQTNHSTNQERPCTTTHRIKKELSICQSCQCLDLVNFSVLSQIKPQAPLLVVPFRQFLQVSALRPYSPQNPKTLISPMIPKELENLLRSLVGIVYGQDYDGI
eukprot:TRINITY_DN7_c0_g1_i34.p1 TRINITY_DN7_c0_g1~~TRINITY_DN7_c0_g1_i34.p1  ORF type:complete len:236 (+),score=-19.23 TRINITY_DN7_c0_g1_i34:611-1318(+)